MNIYKVIAIIVIAKSLTACDLRETIMPRLVAGQEEYLGHERFTGSELVKITKGIYSYRWLHYRNLVLDTAGGWVIIDPLNKDAASKLKGELDRLNPNKAVEALIYSHYHLDHTIGGSIFNPRRVIAHSNAPQYWQDFDTHDVVPPTELLEGDQTLFFGTTELKLLDLKNSHTDSLFAFHLPKERVLFSVDMGLVQAFLPMGHPDSYGPGVISALERMAEIDFDIFVPSHFDLGKKSDLVDYLEFQKEVRVLAREALTLYGPAYGATLPTEGDALKLMFFHVYKPLKDKYRDWHGFNQQSLYIVFSSLTGEALGF